ncbi:MAG: hypothetical protein J1E37_06145 [Prevotella sp.]|nr:hypothetical protein [Prevotella sp.]
MMEDVTYEIGSQYFFSKFPDYKVNDYDYLVLTEKIHSQMRFRDVDKDIVIMPRKTKEEYLKPFIDNKATKESSLYAGKFLMPEFAKDLGITIEDLKDIKHHIYETDSRHQYQRVILDAYIENDDFTLTEEQLNEAYMVYKESREG